VETVGAFLREARETTGRSVADVALSLRIHPKFVEAIEDSRYQDLPGPTYAVGFVRSYADYLGLDTETLVGQYKAESRAADDHPDLEFLAPATVGWFPTGKVVAICCLLAVAVFGGWFYLQNEGAVDVAAIPIPPGFTSAAGVTAADEKPVAVQIAAAPVTGGSNASPATVEPAATEEPYRLPVPARALVLPDPAATLEDLQQTAPADTATDTTADTTADTTGDAAAEPVVSPPAPAVTTSEPVVTTPEPVQAAPAEVSEAPELETPVPAETETVEIGASDAETPPAPSTPTPAAPDSVVETTTVTAPPPPPAPVAATVTTQVASLPSIPAESGQAEASGGGRTYGVINQEARVIIGAKADSWVQVLDNQQNVVLTRMLRAGDRYLVPDRDDLVMLTGNAGGLIISVDGAQVPKIGSDGAILHNVRLDVELLKAGRAVIQ
jgi:cytoskeletal protein RodZ